MLKIYRFPFSWHASKWRTKSKRLVHHTLGNGDFDVFIRLLSACLRSYYLTPENCVEEMERVIDVALKERQPVYIGIPSDYMLIAK